MKLCFALLLLFLAAALHLIASVPILLGAILVAVFGALAFLGGRNVGKWIVCLLAVMLTGCVDPPPAPVKDRFTVQQIYNPYGANFYLLHERATGREYLKAGEAIIELRTSRAAEVEKP